MRIYKIKITYDDNTSITECKVFENKYQFKAYKDRYLDKLLFGKIKRIKFKRIKNLNEISFEEFSKLAQTQKGCDKKMELYKIQITNNDGIESVQIRSFKNTAEFEMYSVARSKDLLIGIIKDFQCEHLNLDEVKSMKTSEVLDTIGFGDFCRLVKELGD